MKFTELNLTPEILRAIEDAGFTDATPIQAECIPTIASHVDIIGQSQTGTGKTAAFSIPLLTQIIPSDHKRPQALILCPTRELALQITEQIRIFSKYMQGIRTVTVFGGQPINIQLQELRRGADIIVGTPGRVIDHIKRKTLRFEHLTHLVLDEADEMLQMGFKEELEEILSVLPKERQTSLFSATMPRSILDIVNNYLVDPKHISIAPKQRTLEKIRQIAYEVPTAYKNDLLIQLLRLYNPASAMIFTNTKKMADDLADLLAQANFSSSALHGDMKQEMRTAVMGKFKRGHIRFLIATDVAARGIDVDSMEMVINYDVPQDDEYYIHRIGRTGRAGSDGIAITFVTHRDARSWGFLVRNQRLNVETLSLPTQSDLDNIQKNQLKNSLTQKMAMEIPSHIEEMAADLLEEGMNPQMLIQVLLTGWVSESKLTAIPPVKAKNHRTYHTFTLNVGSKHGISPTKLIKQTSKLCGIEEKHIGDIRISGNNTTMQVAAHIEVKKLQKLSKMPSNQKVVVALSSTGDKRNR